MVEALRRKVLSSYNEENDVGYSILQRQPLYLDSPPSSYHNSPPKRKNIDPLYLNAKALIIYFLGFDKGRKVLQYPVDSRGLSRFVLLISEVQYLFTIQYLFLNGIW